MVRAAAHSHGCSMGQIQNTFIRTGVNTMTFYISLVAEYLKNYMKTRLTYRSDFWIDVISDLMFNGLNLFFILVVFANEIARRLESRTNFVHLRIFYDPVWHIHHFFNLWGFGERYIVKGKWIAS